MKAGIMEGQDFSEAESGEIPQSPQHTSDTAHSKGEPGQTEPTHSNSYGQPSLVGPPLAKKDDQHPHVTGPALAQGNGGQSGGAGPSQSWPSKGQRSDGDGPPRRSGESGRNPRGAASIQSKVDEGPRTLQSTGEVGGAAAIHGSGGEAETKMWLPPPPAGALPHHRAYLLGPKICFTIGGSDPTRQAATSVRQNGEGPADPAQRENAIGSGEPQLAPHQAASRPVKDDLLKEMAQESFKAASKPGLASRWASYDFHQLDPNHELPTSQEGGKEFSPSVCGQIRQIGPTH
jgi:hypothetical protein